MNKSYTDLVVFFVPPEQYIGGGIISIFSLCKETREVVSATTRVLIATYPGTPTYGKNDSFENDEIIFDFETVVKDYPTVNSAILHIPEYSVETVTAGLDRYTDYLESIKNLQINILNQNIKMMPDESIVAGLFAYTSNVTQTTAHLRYTNQELADRYRTPVHLFSVRIDPVQYVHKQFQDKENIVLFSPDEHPLRSKLINTIRDQTDFEVIEIHDLTFEQYKALIAKAKFTVTFGEGMDGYFIESTYSDSIGFTAYNEDYFPSKEYLELPNVYPDYETLVTKLPKDLKALAIDEKLYRATNEATANLLNKIYGEHFFKENVRRFYKHDYSFVSKKKINREFLMHILKMKNAHIGQLLDDLASAKEELESIKNQLNQEVGARNEEIMRIKTIADDRLAVINQMHDSISWKVTKPIRAGKHILHKKRSR